jgi:hypothetical protein
VKPKRKPTRRDLLVIIGRLQQLIGRADGAAGNDRNPNRAATVKGVLTEALELCISARSYDPPVDSGPWSVRPPERRYV